MSSLVSLLLLVVVGVVVLLPAAVWAQFPGGGGSSVTMTNVANFGKNPTSCKMQYWKPTGVTAGTKLPTIVAPHYCGANAKSAESWYKLTPKSTSGTVKFMVIYPENSHSGGCWEPWNADAMKHDVGGDTLAVAEMVRYAIASLDADPARIYITGFSSGASMSSAMGAVYPELFEGLSSFSGVPPGCIDPAVGGGGGIGGGGGGMGGGKPPAPSTCFGGNFSKTIDEWGKLVHAMNSAYTGRYPRAQVYHGNNDELLDYRFFFEEIKIWQSVHNFTGTLPTTPQQTRFGGSGTTPMIEANYMQGTHALTYQTDAVLAFFGLNDANFKPPGKTDTPTAVNACAANNGGCAATATCTPTTNTRTCACNTGYTGNGVTCTAVPAANACKTNNGGCDVNAACTLNGAVAACKCNTGYTGDGTTCTKPVETTNACQTSNGGCDKTNAVCSLSAGKATCKCKTGFTSTDSGKTCVTSEVPTTENACEVDNGGCDADYGTCRLSATTGAVRCGCVEGYTLNTDQKTCKENGGTPPTTVNKCKTNNGGCDAAAGICALGADGSTVTCSCEEGYKLATNKRTCTILESNKCTATSCQNGGVCQASGVCACGSAWSGLTCSTCAYTIVESDCIQDEEQTKDTTPGTATASNNTTTYIIIAAAIGIVLLGLGVYIFVIRPKATFQQHTNKMNYSNTNMTPMGYNQQPYQSYNQPPPPGRY